MSMKRLGPKWPSLVEGDNRLCRKHRMPKDGLKGIKETNMAVMSSGMKVL